MTSTKITSGVVFKTDLATLRKSVAQDRALRLAEAKRLRQAAECIADAARVISARFSTRIPNSIRVTGGVSGVFITARGSEAPNAEPFETGRRHPLFGNREHWYPQPKREFLEEAAAAAGEEAAEIFSEILDDWLKSLNM